jgi:tetratricopeptide (TPR) repeat protein
MAVDKALKKKIDALSVRGDYESALELVKEALRSQPDDFDLRYLYAKFLGDWADELPAARKRKFKNESIEILKELMTQLRGRDLTTRWRLPLNFYYQSEDWKGMYAFGQRFARTDKRLAHYTKGIGATYLAEGSSGKTRRAWASKGVRAWRAYGLAREKYYFAHYVFAKALALNGDADEALKRLTTAAKLGKRPITDWEFADVLKLLKT